MNVPSVFPTSTAGADPALLPLPVVGASAFPASAPSATATISPRAHLLSRLQAIALSDPAGLAAVAGQLATITQAAAAKTSGDEKASLTKFGDALARVAKDGDLSALKPVHHHHPHAGKHLNGGTGALLNNLLQEIDTVLGPHANVTPQT